MRAAISSSIFAEIGIISFSQVGWILTLVFGVVLMITMSAVIRLVFSCRCNNQKLGKSRSIVLHTLSGTSYINKPKKISSLILGDVPSLRNRWVGSHPSKPKGIKGKKRNDQICSSLAQK